MSYREKLLTALFFLIFLFLNSGWICDEMPPKITPNDFKGTDTERIQQAIEAAVKTTGLIEISFNNANGSNYWLIDEAILLPDDITILMNNCTLQLSDLSRDNMFRTNNVGAGISDPGWNKNIHLSGVGRVILKGAENPRSTGDGGRTLVLDPDMERVKGNSRVSYGTDAAKADERQKGDWRNILILIAQTDGFSLKNIRIENTHAWAVSFERSRNVTISDIEIYNPEQVRIYGKDIKIFNRDGINLRQGCKNFQIKNISGFTGDDFIALSSLDVYPEEEKISGSLNSTMVTPSRWYGPEDDIEDIYISDIQCESICRGIAIRASDSAGIHHVYIRGLTTREVKGKGGKHNAVLIGGKGYGKISQPGKINNIYVMDVLSDGYEAVMIEAPVFDCHFMNFLYSGHEKEVIRYALPREEMRNITESNLVLTREK